ncbi:hypothetical protein EV360DRAFT_66310 [Lentinula raphanica]|nr:hypothetical protein EV360DRAFT_66310 [Lentinula raphanica]
MFALSTTLWALDITDFVRGLYEILGRTDGTTTQRNSDYMIELNPRVIAQTTIFSIEYLIGDSVVVWRACALWGYSKKVMLLPTLLLSAAAGLHDWEYILGEPEVCYNSYIGTFFLSIAINLLATSLIATKAWMHHRFLRSASVKKSTRVLKIMILLVESGFIYLVIWGTKSMSIFMDLNATPGGQFAVSLLNSMGNQVVFFDDYAIAQSLEQQMRNQQAEILTASDLSKLFALASILIQDLVEAWYLSALLRLVPSLVPQLFAQARPHFANTIATSSTAFHFVLRPLIQIPAWYFKTPQIFSTKTCQVDSFLEPYASKMVNTIHMAMISTGYQASQNQDLSPGPMKPTCWDGLFRAWLGRTLLGTEEGTGLEFEDAIIEHVDPKLNVFGSYDLGGIGYVDAMSDSTAKGLKHSLQLMPSPDNFNYNLWARNNYHGACTRHFSFMPYDSSSSSFLVYSKMFDTKPKGNEYLIGDSMVVWRACALWGYSKKIMLLPILLLFSAAVLVFFFVGCLGFHNWEYILGEPEVCFNSYMGTFFLSIAINLLATSLIATKACVSVKKSNKVLKIMILLVESGFIYLVIWGTKSISILIDINAGTPGGQFAVSLLNSMGNQVVGLYPTLLMVLANAQYSAIDAYSENLDVWGESDSNARTKLHGTGEGQSAAYSSSSATTIAIGSFNSVQLALTNSCYH